MQPAGRQVSPQKVRERKAMSKRTLSKKSKKKLKFSEAETENSLSDRSFVEKFLESLRKKMYKK